MFILLTVPDLFRVLVMDSDESGQFRELGSDEDYDGYSSQSRSRSRRISRSRSRSPSRSRSRSGRRSGSRRHTGQSGHSSEAAMEEARLLVEQDMVKLCDTHKLDIQPGADCVKCRLVSRTVGRNVLPEVIKLLRAKAASTSDIPSAAERYAARLDKKPPSLTLTESDLSLAVSVFSRGKMIPPSMFEELTREFLFLPQGQNEMLTRTVQLERMFNKFKHNKNFSNIFSYIEKLAKVAKHFRVSERPVILAMGELTHFMNEVRTSGKELGFQYPENLPLVQLLGPRKVQDRLAYKQLPTFSSPCPQIADLLKDTTVSSEDRAIIAANLSCL